MALTPCVFVVSSLCILAQASTAPQGLTVAGWIFMVGSICGVLGFVGWSYSRLLRSSDTSPDSASDRAADD